MSEKSRSSRIREEAGEQANRYTFKALSAVMLIIMAVLGLNGAGVFELDQTLMKAVSFACIGIYLVLFLITRNRNSYKDERLAYLMIFSVMIMTLVLTIFLNLPATLALLLPLMFSTQYRSMNICNLTVLCSILCAAFSPLIALQVSSYNLAYLSGYIESATGLKIIGLEQSSLTYFDRVRNILLYLSLPQVLIIIGFGFIAYSITKNNISGVNAKVQAAVLNDEVERHLEKEMQVQESIVNSLSDIIESRDNSTGQHVARTKQIVRLVVDKMVEDPQSGVDREFGDLIVAAAPLHDVGKIAISDTILCKPGELTAEEKEIIKTHTVKSEQIIERVFSGIEDEDLITVAKHIGRSHHERYDGTGYPDGLKGDQIPLEARIMTIADVYDALRSKRYYKVPFTKEKTLLEIQKEMGKQFDGNLEKYFLAALPEIEEIYSE